MPSYQTIRRPQEAIQYTADSTSVAKLQRNYNYSFIWLFLNVKFKVLKDKATLKYNHFANLVRTISIFGNGNTEFKNQDFASLLFQTYLLTKGKMLMPRPDLTFTADGGDKNTKDYVLPVLMPLESLSMNYISDTGLLSENFQTLDFQVNWTNSSAVGDGIEIIKATLKPVSFEKIMQKDNKGVLSGKIPSRLIQKTQSEQITTSSEGILINVPPKKWYQSFQLDVLNGNTGEAVEGAITRIKFLQGVDILADIEVPYLQVDNQRRFDLDYQAFKAIYGAEITANKCINPLAHFMLDFSVDGDYTNSMVTQNYTMPQISVDTQLPAGISSIKLKVTCNYIESL